MGQVTGVNTGFARGRIAYAGRGRNSDASGLGGRGRICAMVETLGEFSSLAGRRVMFSRYGPPDGHRILFHYGSPGTRHLGSRMAEVVERHGVQLLVLDRPGYGASTRRPGRRIADVVEDVAVLVDMLGWERFAGWGGSGGGPHALACARVVDLSGAFRLRTPENYAAWYKETHTQPDLLAEAVYGLPEFCRALIPAARLVSNPGCSPTAANLALRPLVQAGVIDRASGIVCDAKSGVSGAGRKPSLKTSFCEVADNFSAYSILHHRHVPEVLQISG